MMNKQTKSVRIGLTASAIVLLLGGSRAYSEWKLQSLLNV